MLLLYFFHVCAVCACVSVDVLSQYCVKCFVCYYVCLFLWLCVCVCVCMCVCEKEHLQDSIRAFSALYRPNNSCSWYYNVYVLIDYRIVDIWVVLKLAKPFDIVATVTIRYMLLLCTEFELWSLSRL